MTAPEGWHLKTPALASRRGSRGIPTPAFMIAMLFMGGIPLATFGRMNWYGAVALGFTLGAGLLYAVYKFSKARNDRDWFEISVDWLAIKITLLKLMVWERIYKWR